MLSVMDMGILIDCQAISKAYSGKKLFDELCLTIEDENRIGLIGPNGSGKSTLLRMLAGHMDADEGEIVTRKGLRVSAAFQEADRELPADQSVQAFLKGAVEQLEWQDYEKETAVDQAIKRFGFKDREKLAGELSGGWRKRLCLAAAIAARPDLLILDEPTNHLDLEAVLELETILAEQGGSFIVVTHDRAFLQAISNRIIELNPRYPSGYLSVSGSFADFLRIKEEKLSEQANLEQSLASKVRREIAWLSRGARARQTKSSHRIEEAGKLKEDLETTRSRNRQTQLDVSFQSSGRRSKELVNARGIEKSLSGRMLFADLDLLVTSRTRLGIVGRNGCGKTTLLRALTGEIECDRGSIKRAEGLKIVWFEQDRKSLDLDGTLKQALAGENDSVSYRGRSMHITTWARKLLFETEKLPLTLGNLSGGEQARVLIARLMLQEADVLILDEPTNDLDIPTLEVLEDSLSEFPGAVILVSHDRMLLDTVCQEVLALTGDGQAEFFAGYTQFEPEIPRFFKDIETAKGESKPRTVKPRRERSGLTAPERRDLESLPGRIETTELAIAALEEKMMEPDIASDFSRLSAMTGEQEILKKELESLYERWQELEAKALA